MQSGREREREGLGNTERDRDPRTTRRHLKAGTVWLVFMDGEDQRHIPVQEDERWGGVFVCVHPIHYEGGALKAIADKNRLRLRGNEIFVGEAKFRRDNFKGKELQTNAGTRKGEANRVVNQGKRHAKDGHPVTAQEGGCGSHYAWSKDDLDVMKSKEHVFEPQQRCSEKGTEAVGVRIQASMAESNLEWLRRSLVGSTRKAIDYSLLNAIARRKWPQVVKVCELGAYKALLIFDSSHEADEALTFSMNGLLKFFYRVGRWSKTDRCDRRRVWLECIRVPGTTSGESFSVGRVLIDTRRFEVIHERIGISVGMAMFDVLVTEAEGGAYTSLGHVTMAGKRGNQGRYSGGDSASGERDSTVEDVCGQLGSGDAATVMLELPVKEEVTMKGRVVISTEDLDEWDKKLLNFKLTSTAITEADLTGRVGDEVDVTSSRRGVGLREVHVGPNGLVAQNHLTMVQENHLTMVQENHLGLPVHSPFVGFERSQILDQANREGEWVSGRVRPKDPVHQGSRPDGDVLVQDGVDLVCDTNGRAARDALRCDDLDGTEMGTPTMCGKEDRTSVAQGSRESLIRWLDGISVGSGRTESRVVTARMVDLVDDLSGAVLGIDGGPGWYARKRESTAGLDGYDEATRRLIGGSCENDKVVGDRNNPEDLGVSGGARCSADVQCQKCVSVGNVEPGPDAGQAQGLLETLSVKDAGIGGEIADVGEEQVDVESDGDLETDDTKRTKEVQENRKAWDFAVESGAVLYNEDEDIMAILQAQNEEIALRRKQAKQKEKARRSRLIETKKEVVTKFDVVQLLGNSGMCWEYVEAEGTSGGLLLMWDATVFKLSNCYEGAKWLCVDGVLEELSFLTGLCQVPFCFMGDFNEIVHVEERLGAASMPQSATEFNSWIQEMELRDLALIDHRFTWFRGQSCSRIDRILVSVEWLEEFPETRLRGGPRGLSDHCPMILNITRVDESRRPFRSLDSWFTHDGFLRMVKEE
ncbi:uncharacterized protein DS421_12g371150 [Arachis hypogaea]|nr:uncharacterized protein DS421_12g371150 [Arachis hypogaea]